MTYMTIKAEIIVQTVYLIVFVLNYLYFFIFYRNWKLFMQKTEICLDLILEIYQKTIEMSSPEFL